MSSTEASRPGGERATRLFFAAAVLVPLAILAVVGLLSYRQVEAEAAERAHRTAFALSEHALRTVRAHELIMNAVDRYIAGMRWKDIASSRRVHDYFAELSREEDVNTVFVIDPNGTEGASSLRFPLAPIDVRDRSFFTGPKAGEPLHVSLADVGRISGQRIFNLARRRSGPAGAFDGIISVSVNPAYFEDFYVRVLEMPDDAAGLARADGQILARVPRIPAGVTLRGVPLLEAVRANPQGGTFESTSEGIERLFAYRKVGNYPLYVAYGLSRGTIWAAWRRSMATYAMICGIAMALLLAAAALVRQRTLREWEAARAYAEEAARRSAAEEASRSKDEFMATLSHELRNPLAAISNSVLLLKRSEPADAVGREALDIVSRQVGHLQRLLNDLLDVARTIYGKVRLDLQEIELGAFAREVATGAAAARGQRAAVKVGGGPVWVSADPTRLRQMLENLVDNAIKFGGRRIDVMVSRRDGHAVLAVADDGEGIPAELMAKLFQPFVQGAQALDRARGGLGLGLSLVHRLATLHGGALSAQSEGPGKGSRFEIVLPAIEPAPAARPASTALPAARRRVLIIEDHRDARESLERLLAMEGHEVAAVGSGADGLARLATFRPEVALVDIGLPGMDGYAWAREVRSRRGGESLRLVALTGYGQAEDREKAHQAGFDVHLTKPVSLAALAEALGRNDKR